MAKALSVVDKDDASGLQPIDRRSGISLTQCQRPRRQLLEERVTHLQLSKVAHAFIRRHDSASRTGDLHALNGHKLRVIGRDRCCNARIGLDFQ